MRIKFFKMQSWPISTTACSPEVRALAMDSKGKEFSFDWKQILRIIQKCSLSMLL